MSTRTRESGPPGKEKRGTSPSPTLTGSTQRRRSPIPSKTTSADSGKNIPSYLKPTASSINDASKQLGRKPISPIPDTANKPNLARRRSFDKPPSPSRTQKSPLSPNPTLRSSSFSGKITTDSANKPALARRRSFDKPPSPSRTQKSPVSPNPALRSSSLPGKVGASQKGASDRSLKGPKESGKQHTLYARPVSNVKKSSVLAKKNEPAGGSSRKGRVVSSPGKVERPNVLDVPEPEPEPQSDEQEHFIIEEQTVLVGDYIDKESEDSLLDDQEVPNIIEKNEGESEDNDAAEVVTVESPIILEQHDDNIVMVETPMIIENEDDKVVVVEDSMVSEHHDANLDVDLEDEPLAVEISSQQEEIKEDATNEMNDTDDIDETDGGNARQEVEDKEREDEQEEDNEEEAVGLVNKEEEVERGSEDELKEKEVAVEETSEAETATPRVAHGKKDVALSNDVIEETRNKLIEQRKNKVRALAGAFETVISLQDPK